MKTLSPRQTRGFRFIKIGCHEVTPWWNNSFSKNQMNEFFWAFGMVGLT